MLYPEALLTWNALPNPIAYSAKEFTAILKSRLIETVVILEVTASLLLSIMLRNLLYLNLAPYLFKSLEFAYFIALSDTIVPIELADGAKFVL